MVGLEIERGKIVPVVVDYETLVEQAVSDALYDRSDKGLTTLNFPREHERCHGERSIEIELVRFNECLPWFQLVAEIWEFNLRHSTVREILALGAQRPDLHCQMLQIVALGSHLQIPSENAFSLSTGYPSFPCLDARLSDRRLTLERDCDFPPDMYYAVVFSSGQNLGP